MIEERNLTKDFKLPALSPYAELPNETASAKIELELIAYFPFQANFIRPQAKLSY
jgi:hypothetical protein